MPDRPGSAPRAGSAATKAGAVTTSPARAGDEVQDLALVRSITSGEAGAWRLLLGRHQANVYNLCLKLVGNRDLAEDLAQDTLVKIVQHIARFDGRAKFSTWLYRITMNVCLSRLRAEKVRRHSSLDDQPRDGTTSHAAMIAGREPGAMSSVQSAELSRNVLSALGTLEPEQRAILVLRDTRDLDYDQIAEILDVPVGTVKSRLFRARAALRTALEQLESGDGSCAEPENP
ncbi:MAG: sigma-70 family RNA polymerase sigma factor [Phycisphaeraceae bacterium]|nr:sigma-70 family RNA polymerase sigma factor [Phycisphaeraceae bacterium]